MIQQYYSMSTAMTHFSTPTDLNYGYQVFIDELIALESFYTFNNKELFTTDNLIKEYRALLERVKVYTKTNKKSTENGIVPLEKKDIAILTYVHSAILSRINRVNSSESTDLVINISAYLDLIKENISKLNNKEKIHKIECYKKDFNAKITAKIEEAKKFVEEILDVIESYNKELNIGISTVSSAISKLIQEEKDNIEKKEKLEKELESKFVARIIFRSIDMGASILALTGPTGQLAGVIVGTSSTIAKNAFIREDQYAAEIGKAAKEAAKNWKEIREKEYEKEKTDLKTKLNGLEAQIKAFKEIDVPLKTEVIKKEIDALRKKIKTDKDNVGKYNAKIFELQEQLEEQKNLEKQELSEQIKQRSGDLALKAKMKKFESAMKWTQGIAEAANCGFDIAQLTIDNNKAKEVIANAIRASRKKIGILKNTEDKIGNQHKTCKGEINKITKDIKDLEGKSHIVINVSNWKIKTQLKGFKRIFHSYETRINEQLEHKMGVDFTFIFEKISDAFETITGIYNQVDRYKDQAQMVNYIAAVNTAGIDSGIKELNSLKSIILQNIIMERYTRLMSTAKQWAFPFAHTFFADFKFFAKKKIDVKEMIINIDSLKDKIDHYKATITKLDGKIISTQFGGNGHVIAPFYTWRSNQYGNEINTLFEQKEGTDGHKIILKAPINGSIHNFNRRTAIKFKTLKLEFKHENSKQQEQLDNCLNHFNVRIIGAAACHYYFAKRIYEFGGNLDSNEPLELMYSYKTDAKGKPMLTNGVYDKLLKGDIFLSPFTIWQIRLEAIDANEATNQFNQLEQYKNKVNLELTGKGIYVDEKHMKKKTIEELQLAKYYLIKYDN